MALDANTTDHFVTKWSLLGRHVCANTLKNHLGFEHIFIAHDKLLAKFQRLNDQA